MRSLLLSLPALLLCAPATAQTAPAQAPAAVPVQAAPEFRARVNELAEILSGKGNYDAYFAPAFRAQVPKEKFNQIVAQLLVANGPYSDLQHLEAATPWSGTVTVEYRDALATARIAVDPNAPHQVTGLLINGVTAREKTLDEVAAAVKGLHGASGLALARLGAGAPQMLVEHNADRLFAIGSEFKLVILAELIRATNAGERKWDDLVTLDGAPLPGGGYAQKPAGTQVSLRELATQMISVSDNSATDVLLKALGREKVEAMMPVVGIKDPARNRPFLATAELFKLKGVGGGALARRYLALDEAGRRKLLAGEVAATPLSAVDPMLFKDGKPVMIDQLEWFESPADLVRVMDWIRRNTEAPKGADARAVLSKNAGIPPLAAGKWQYVGYKGGSEPGVMAMTLLLQARNGDWYVLTGSWNDPARDVETGRFAGLIGKAAELAAPAP
ncbi:class A beta-lactamase-related serine hydrolase [Sphingomonas cannabina]|uniref:serine hydrolase n=1 Tax=Sphingomonas cannabina TaxID=2899123 RepID=UPI001F2C6991|nr:serine hydrolase [Sphingomonas cannabina]UIJ44573.1 class A beta-lactamase-related serine hydrolase [Sphingomonas cannabina]